MKLKSIAILMVAALLFMGCNDNQNLPKQEYEFDLLFDNLEIQDGAVVKVSKINEETQAVGCRIVLRNNTDKEMSVMLTKELIKSSVDNGAASNVFCWGVCAGPSVTSSTAQMAPKPGIETDPVFDGDMLTENFAAGTTTLEVRYVFTNEATKFSRTVNVVYSCTK